MKAGYLFLSLVAIICFFGSCSRHNVVTHDITEEIIFIADESDHNLPAYTESGYNTFGALFEKDYFVVNKGITPLKMQYHQGKMLVVFDGVRKRTANFYSSNIYAPMTMYFTFPFDECKSYEDLLKLHNTKINLTATGCEVKMKIGEASSATTLDVVEGELFFRRAQNLNIDDNRIGVILSGTFFVKFKKGSEYTVIKNGRFDFSINQNYFTYISPNP